jgi:hypothetical protein
MIWIEVATSPYSGSWQTYLRFVIAIKVEELHIKMAKQMIRTVKNQAVMSGDKPCANAAIRSKKDWETIKWDCHTKIVKKLQLRIAKAAQSKKFRKVKHLQWILVHSLSAKYLAVKDIMQNSGSKTPGVDGITIKTSAEKLALARSLTRRNYKPLPLSVEGWDFAWCICLILIEQFS